MWNIYLYFIILKLFTNFQNIIFLVKIVANACLLSKDKSVMDLADVWDPFFILFATVNIINMI
jgi:hypothetical protein